MRLRRADAGVLVLFVALSIAHTWPVASYPSRLFANHPDVFSNVWALNELARTVVRTPLHPLDGNIFFPYGNTLAVHDHHFANLLITVPLRLFTISPLLIYNIVFLLSFILSGLFTYVLVERLTGDRVAGIIAGCVFAFSAYRFTHYIHLHLLTTQWLPVALLQVHRFLEEPTWKRLTLLTAAGLLLALSSWQIGLIGASATLIVAVWTMVGGRMAPTRRVAMGLIGVIVVGATLLPLAQAYRRMSEWHLQSVGGVRTRELARGAVPLEGFVTPGDSSRQSYLPFDRDSFSESRTSPGIASLALAALGLLTLARREQASPTGLDRAVRVAVLIAGTLGALAVAGAVGGEPLAAVLAWIRPAAPFALLAVLSAVAWLRRARRMAADDHDGRLVVTYAALCAAGVVLSLGPRVYGWETDLGSGVLRTDLVPGLFRAPGRFAMVMFMGLAVLAGYGGRRLLGTRTGVGRVVLAVAVVAALNLDLWPRLPMLEVSQSRRTVHRWLAERIEPGAIIEYPYSQDWAVFASLSHDRRLVNGLGVAEPPGVNYLREPEAFTGSQLSVIWEYLHPRFVVFRGSLYGETERDVRLDRIRARPDVFVLRADFGQDKIYELVDRGAGPALFRRWPREALGGRQGLEFVAEVESVPDGTSPRLSVALNERTVLDLDGERVLQPERHFAAIDETNLRSGLNSFEIRADYRRINPTYRHAVGSTGIDIGVDVGVSSLRDLATVQINGRVVEFDKGYLLVSLDAGTGEVTGVGRFNTSWYEADAVKLAAFVEQLVPGTVVIVASAFDVSRRLTGSAAAALKSLGLRHDLRDRFGSAHAAIGVKGAPSDSALEVVGDHGDAGVTLGAPERPIVRLSSLDLL